MPSGKVDAIMDRLADVYYPVGHYVITSTNTNPNTLGINGTWTLKSKTLKTDLDSLIGDNGTVGKFFTANTTNFTLTNIWYRSDGSTIWVVMRGFNKVALSDTQVNVGSFDFTKLGSSIGGYNVYSPGMINSNKVAFMFVVDVSNSTANVNIIDIIADNAATSFAAQSSSYLWFQFPLHLTTSDGLWYNDSLCDQFHWLRTA